MRVTNQERAAGRRDEIIRATIAVLAERGYSATSFARIVEHAGISSTRLVSYHFESREALMRATLEHVVAEAAAVMQPLMAQETTARGQLAAYIRGNLGFLAERPAHARAAVEIVANLPAPQDLPDSGDASVNLLVAHFSTAQAAGEMRAFDPQVMAVTVRAAIDAAVIRAGNTDVDLSAWAEELVSTFDRAVTSEEKER
jgi:AcrR family transcriptional regulator